MGEVRVDLYGNSYFEAIEVWNEMNIDREWPRGEISPASYTELLRPDRDSLAVGLTRGQATLEAGYIFRRDACGVVRVAGPDTLTVP